MVAIVRLVAGKGSCEYLRSAHVGKSPRELNPPGKMERRGVRTLRKEVVGRKEKARFANIRIGGERRTSVAKEGSSFKAGLVSGMRGKKPILAWEMWGLSDDVYHS